MLVTSIFSFSNNVFPGVEINFFCYLQKIASAIISNLLNATCYSQMKSMIFFYIIVNIINLS